MKSMSLLPSSALKGDADDEKYGKKVNLRRTLSNAAIWGKKNKHSVAKTAAFAFAAVLLLLLLTGSKSTKHGEMDIEMQKRMAEEELNNLGVTAAQNGDAYEQQPEEEERLADSTTAEAANDDDSVQHEIEATTFLEEDADSNNSEEDEEETEPLEDDQSQPMTTLSNIPEKSLLEMSNEELFSNHKELEECGRINVQFPFKKRPTDWWALRAYTKLYSEKPPYACIPKLRPHLQLTLEEFTVLFRRYAQPVLFRFENLRKIGFSMRSFTLDELSELFPFDPTKDKPIEYKANKKFTEEYLDLGPAVYSFKDDGALVKTKGGKRNYPRNMKVRPSALSKLGVQAPFLIPGAESVEGVFQSPSLWFGSSTSPTPFHSDCCDNFVLMLTGTKEFALAPPTDWHALTPHCIGKRKNLCYASIADPTAAGVDTSSIHKMVVDVEPGMILYMPSGWFHAIKNKGATLMTNLWTRGKQTAGIFSCNKK